MKKYFFFLTFFSFAFIANAQTFSLQGKIIDAETKNPLPFVSVTITGEQQGTTADIDGHFTITSSHPINSLSFSYLGYQTFVYKIKSSENQNSILIKLEENVTQLKEVTILPGINPADRIIRLAIENSDKNNPEKNHSFTYTSYNKMFVTADMKSDADSLNSLDTLKKDSKIEKLLKKQYLFLMESVSNRDFMYPDNNKETIIASRTSGLKNSPFALLATQMQSFSFYTPEISILGKKYINPISKGSLKKYFFLLKDTIFQGKDTVYIISFQPKKRKVFEGLKGVLYINTNGYAIQNVLAQPAIDDGKIDLHIQQKYACIDNTKWFPVQLNTDWIYNDIFVGDSVVAMGATPNENSSLGKIKAVSRSYLKNIVLDPPLKRKEFNQIQVAFADDASKKSDAFWNQYRVDSLSTKEKKTYQVIDSIGTAEHFERKIKAFEILSSGKIPIGIFNLDMNRFLRYNRYEGFRLGLGAHTSDKFSKFFSVGGYGAYGFTDKAFKYGGDANFELNKAHEINFKVAYSNDVIESGGTTFYDDESLISTNNFRDYLVQEMDKIQKEEASLNFRALHYFKFNCFVNEQLRTTTNNYAFGISENNATVLLTQYRFSEAGIGFRWAYKEKFIQTPFSLVSLGTKYPIVFFKFTQGFNNLMNGQFQYSRYDLKIEKKFVIRNLGESTLRLMGGYIQGNLPYTNLYNGIGSFLQYGISAPNSFETMRMNEFLSNKYAALFYIHTFNPWIRIGKFSPSVAVVEHIGFGSLNNPQQQFNIPVNTMNKGYYESGLEINNILTSGFAGVGVGVFYRYGPYSLPTM
ncbi:MAG TPA: DUF5686 family protein, partial [Bacteroidia bacterium]|nr:DUF5686 family protein [Bacteroidia bacterium]